MAVALPLRAHHGSVWGSRAEARDSGTAGQSRGPATESRGDLPSMSGKEGQEGEVAQEGKEARVVLDYELVMGVPVVEVEVDGTSRKLILDTGSARSVVVWALPPHAYSSPAQSSSVHSRAMHSSLALSSPTHSSPVPSRTTLCTIRLGGFAARGIEALVIDESNEIFRATGAEGIIGGDVLRRYRVVFDSREGTVTLIAARSAARRARDTSLATPSRQSLGGSPRHGRWQRMKLHRRALPMLRVAIRHPDTGVQTEQYICFDSGNGTRRLLLHDFGSFEKMGVIASAQTGFGVGTLGIGGLRENGQSRRGLTDLTMGGVVMRSVPVSSHPKAYGLLPMALTELGTLELDYPHRRYRFTPYQAPDDASAIDTTTSCL